MCIHLLTALLNSLPDCSVACKSNLITLGNKSADRGSALSHQENDFEYDKLGLNGYNTAAVSLDYAHNSFFFFTFCLNKQLYKNNRWSTPRRINAVTALQCCKQKSASSTKLLIIYCCTVDLHPPFCLIIDICSSGPLTHTHTLSGKGCGHDKGQRRK